MTDDELYGTDDRRADENNHLRATLARALQGYDAPSANGPPADKT